MSEHLQSIDTFDHEIWNENRILCEFESESPEIISQVAYWRLPIRGSLKCDNLHMKIKNDDNADADGMEVVINTEYLYLLYITYLGIRVLVIYLRI